MKKLIIIAITALATSAAFAQDDAKKADGAKPAKEAKAKGNWMAKLDADKDGSLTKEEFLASAAAKKNAEAAGKRFAKMDTDSDGKLSKDEMAAAMKARAEAKKKAGDKPEGKKKPAAAKEEAK